MKSRRNSILVTLALVIAALVFWASRSPLDLFADDASPQQQARRFLLWGRVHQALPAGIIVDCGQEYSPVSFVPDELKDPVAAKKIFTLGHSREVNAPNIPRFIFLRGHPEQANLGAGEKIEAWALRDAVEQLSLNGAPTQLARFIWTTGPKPPHR